MCGIAGIISARQKVNPEIIELMLAAQRHRGPDSERSVVLSDRVVFGHNRLAIIDLTDSANQPFFSSDGRYCLIFNGEIYNYTELKTRLEPHCDFRTHSDTEVLLAAYVQWGEACLNELIGMFALAIYDCEREEVFFARDRFGVKPLHYAFDSEGTFYFASEIKTLHVAGIPKERKETVWAGFLTNGSYGVGNETFWSGIHKLEAGHYIKSNISQLKVQVKRNRWYDFIKNIKALREDISYVERSYEEHKSHYKNLLEESIRLRFRSDVPVGFNISGGLDSSLLLSIVDALYKKTPIQAFSFYCNDQRYDELPWVEDIIAHTNKPLNKVLLTAAEVPERYELLNYCQDEPYGGIPTIAYSKVFETARELSTIVLLDGNGIDEAWAGYDYYHNNSGNIVQGVKKSPFKPEVLREDFLVQRRSLEYPTPFDEPLLNSQYRDIFHTKLPRALRFNDRISMMYSTELREPFLDHRLVEYAFALPASMKVKNNKVKWALRELTKNYLRSDLVFAPKRPLQTPQREWLTEDLVGWVEGHIEELKHHPWFKADELKRCWSDFKKSDKQNTFFLWQWLSVCSYS